jgi:hypothetical protein
VVYLPFPEFAALTGFGSQARQLIWFASVCNRLQELSVFTPVQSHRVPRGAVPEHLARPSSPERSGSEARSRAYRSLDTTRYWYRFRELFFAAELLHTLERPRLVQRGDIALDSVHRAELTRQRF